MSQGGEEHVHDEHGHQEEAQASLCHDSATVAGSPSGSTSHQQKPMLQTKWPTNVKHVG
jgi:hypothetical protein